MNHNGYTSVPIANEKEPLLEQPQACHQCSNRKRNWFKYHIPRFLLVGLLIYMFAGQYYNKTPQDDIQLFQQEQDAILRSDVCDFDNKGISYDGPSEFVLDPAQFNRLSIKEKTTIKGRRIQLTKGNTNVIYDDSINDIKANIDIKVNEESLLDYIWIENAEHEKEYSIEIHMNPDLYLSDIGCIQVNVNVHVPSLDALKALEIGLANNEINLDKGLTFDDELNLSVANGYIEFVQGITAGDVKVSLANGHIVGIVNTLTGDLTSSIANGHNEIRIKEITKQGNAIIKLSTANGHNELDLPVNFDSKFDLSSVVGRKIVESSEPNKIHRQNGGWGHIRGYFGQNAQTTNQVSLSAANGSLLLKYDL